MPVADSEGRPEYVLVVALHADTDDAVADLRDLSSPGPLAEAVVGAGILRRGTWRSTLTQGSGGTLAYGIGTGAAAGVVAGVFVSRPLVGALAGAGVGAAVGRRLARREVQGLVALLADEIPVGATALLAVVAEEQQHAVRAAMARALRTTARVLDEGPLTGYARGFVRGDPAAIEALERQAGGAPG
ncbi:MAG: DUF1269 domain-containing protein [Candidatus Nanopelagicales bacterium]